MNAANAAKKAAAVAQAHATLMAATSTTADTFAAYAQSGTVASDRFAEFLRDQLAPLGPHRHAAHVRQDRRVLRRVHARDGEGQHALLPAFKEGESFPPLDYQKKGGTIDLSFWRAPERLFDEPDELVIWARAALAAARRVAAKRERTARKRKSKSQL